MEEVRPEVEKLAWATPPVLIQDMDVLYQDRPSTCISDACALCLRVSFLLGTFLWTSKEKYLAIAAQRRAKSNF